jgi:hypothetical protein
MTVPDESDVMITATQQGVGARTAPGEGAETQLSAALWLSSWIARDCS